MKSIKPLRVGQRIVILADNHGDLADREACRAALDFTKHFKPHIKLHLGDCFDFRWLRRSASEDEKRGTPLDDVTGGIEFLKEYQPTHFLNGNHEARIHEAIDSSHGQLSTLSAMLWNKIGEALDGAIVLPYCKRKGILRIGDYNFLHGYTSGVYAVRKAALSYGNCVMGHVHRVDVAPVEHYPYSARGYCTGCLCQLDLDYNSRQQGTLAQSHGFMYGHLIGQRLKLWHAEKIGGHWVFSSEMQTYA